MNINLYLKAHVFNSSNAAVELAQKNIKHQHFAEAMILKKLDNVMNSHNTCQVSKAAKYNGLLSELSRHSAYPARYHSFNTSLASAENIVNTAKGSQPENKERTDRLSKMSAELEKLRKTPAEMASDKYIDFISTPKHISDMKNGILKACNNVIADSKPNLQEVRKITTNLTSLSLVRNDEALVCGAKEFLDKPIDRTDFQSFGNKDGYSAETLQKVKDCVVEIKDWVNQMQAKY
jgi:DNA repair ATPase RecN